LFHRAAIQSGAHVKAMSREQGAKVARAFLAQLGIDKSSTAKLQTLPFEEILAAQTSVPDGGPAYEFLPIVDGRNLPQGPFDPTAPDASASVPVIVSY